MSLKQGVYCSNIDSQAQPNILYLTKNQLPKIMAMDLNGVYLGPLRSYQDPSTFYSASCISTIINKEELEKHNKQMNGVILFPGFPNRVTVRLQEKQSPLPLPSMVPNHTSDSFFLLWFHNSLVSQTSAPLFIVRF